MANASFVIHHAKLALMAQAAHHVLEQTIYSPINVLHNAEMVSLKIPKLMNAQNVSKPANPVLVMAKTNALLAYQPNSSVNQKIV